MKRLIDVRCASGAPTFCPNGVAVQTVVNGINARGDIVGLFVDGTRRQHGFVRTAGRYVTIDVPGELAGLNEITFPTTVNGINPAGDLVCSYTVTATNESAPLDSPAYCPAAYPAACIKGFLSTGRHRFLQNPDGAAAVQIDVPGRANTIVPGINPEGAIVGSYSIGATSRGFVAMPNSEGIQ
jgi:hypothetical protein